MTWNPRWAGVDEVGRGALAGPVVAAAVAWRDGRPPACVDELDDSKKLTPAKRFRLAQALGSDPSVIWAVAWREPQTIDRSNILHASLEALAEAVAALHPPPLGVYVDGNQALRLPTLPQECVPRGDTQIKQIAAASILAKVLRDRWMAVLHQEYPAYGWDSNVGYGTRDHLEALARLGPSRHHRLSFAPCRQLRLLGV